MSQFKKKFLLYYFLFVFLFPISPAHSSILRCSPGYVICSYLEKLKGKWIARETKIPLKTERQGTVCKPTALTLKRATAQCRMMGGEFADLIEEEEGAPKTTAMTKTILDLLGTGKKALFSGDSSKKSSIEEEEEDEDPEDDTMNYL
jgi:hypothetical protein